MKIGPAGKHVAAALLLGLIISTWQERTYRHSYTSVPAQVLCWLGAPLLGLTTTAGNGLGNTFQAIVHAPKLEAENRILREALGRLRNKAVQMAELQAENRRLRALLALAQARASNAERAVAAEVIGREQGPWLQSLLINRGHAASLAAGQVVISPAGVVGQVESVAAHSAVVAPITGRIGGLSALLQNSRTLGLVTGDGGQGCVFQSVSPPGRVRKNDLVLTSGLGGVYPKGLLVGRVRDLEGRGSAMVRWATVAPAVDFGRLEEVLVLSKAQGGSR